MAAPTEKVAKKVGGLAGISAGESAICTCGTGHGLNYRGYDIYDLAEHCEFEGSGIFAIKRKATK